MANRDRFPFEPIVEPAIATTPARDTQGELFARIALRQLPIMKYGPEDVLEIPASPTLH